MYETEINIFVRQSLAVQDSFCLFESVIWDRIVCFLENVPLIVSLIFQFRTKPINLGVNFSC